MCGAALLGSLAPSTGASHPRSRQGAAWRSGLSSGRKRKRGGKPPSSIDDQDPSAAELLLLLDNVRAAAAPRLSAWLPAPGRTPAPPRIRASSRDGGATPNDASCATRDDGRGNVSAWYGASPWDGPAPWDEPDDVSGNAGACRPESPQFSCLFAARPRDSLQANFDQRGGEGEGGGWGVQWVCGVCKGLRAQCKPGIWVRRMETEQGHDWPWSCVPC